MKNIHEGMEEPDEQPETAQRQPEAAQGVKDGHTATARAAHVSESPHASADSPVRGTNGTTDEATDGITGGTTGTQE